MSARKKTPAQVLREIADSDPVGHGQRLARAYGAGPEPTVQVPVSLIEGLLDDYGSRRAQAELDAYALLSQPTPTAEVDRRPCAAETRSWDHFRPEQVDSYWITCDVLGPHGEHKDEHTGLTWRDPSTIRDVTPPSTESTK